MVAHSASLRGANKVIVGVVDGRVSGPECVDQVNSRGWHLTNSANIAPDGQLGRSFSTTHITRVSILNNKNHITSFGLPFTKTHYL
jgi:hypothetical protein